MELKEDRLHLPKGGNPHTTTLASSWGPVLWPTSPSEGLGTFAKGWMGTEGGWATLQDKAS